MEATRNAMASRASEIGTAQSELNSRQDELNSKKKKRRKFAKIGAAVTVVSAGIGAGAAGYLDSKIMILPQSYYALSSQHESR